MKILKWCLLGLVGSEEDEVRKNEDEQGEEITTMRKMKMKKKSGKKKKKMKYKDDGWLRVSGLFGLPIPFPPISLDTNIWYDMGV